MNDENNMVLLDKRDLFDAVRSAIKQQMESLPFGDAADLFAEATDATTAALKDLVAAGTVKFAKSETVLVVKHGPNGSDGLPEWVRAEPPVDAPWDMENLPDGLQLVARWLEPTSGRYDDVLKPFLALMEAELHANAYKGDRPGWLKMSSGDCLLEIYYHVGKLHKAVHSRDSAGISEYAADVANLSMMLTDITGVLCDHEWVDARNSHVKSGEICAKLCGAIRAGNGGTNEKA